MNFTAHRILGQVKSLYHQIFSEGSKVHLGSLLPKIIYFLKGQKAHLSMPFSGMGIPLKAEVLHQKSFLYL